MIGPENATLPGMTVVRRLAYLRRTAPSPVWRTASDLRGRARARHPVPAAEEVEDHAGQGRRAAWPGVTAKDVVLAIIGRIGTAGGTGYAIEFGGSTIRSLDGRPHDDLQHGDRGGRPGGHGGVDETTIDYLRGRPYAPSGAQWEQAVAHWRTLTATKAPSSTRWWRSMPPASCRR